MTHIVRRAASRSSSSVSSRRTQLLARVIETPDLVHAIKSLAPPAFSALVRAIGIEDAGEIVALATTEQLVSAFDEDLFASDRPGEREEFDPKRFVTWLEVLLEAGDDVAARRVSELAEDFVVHAIGSVVFVLDHDALRDRMSEGDDDARQADKAIESALCEEIDGYLLIARVHDGWDATLALVLALDRDHRALLERVLDRCATIAREHVDDLDALVNVLTEGESLAEDLEAAREERRSGLGYVEPRAARSFLALAMRDGDQSASRDPITKAYFRELPDVVVTTPTERRDHASARLLRLLEDAEVATAPRRLAASPSAAGEPARAMTSALQILAHESPSTYGERLEELAYLTNVVVAGIANDGERFRPADAASAVLATIAFGVELTLGARRGRTAAEHADVLRAIPADLLFRRASREISRRSLPTSIAGLLRDFAELDRVSSHAMTTDHAAPIRR
ncbi:hypothetical protein BH09MYX1_BH09MYX1_24180 [soil metagenome]